MTDNKQYPPLPASFGHVHSDGHYCQDMEPSHESWPIDIYTAVQMRAYVDADRAMRAARDAEDAARYRRLRECNSGSLVVVQITGTGEEDWHVLTERDADEAIDAEINAARAALGGQNALRQGIEATDFDHEILRAMLAKVEPMPIVPMLEPTDVAAAVAAEREACADDVRFADNGTEAEQIIRARSRIA